jgi:hypothetical protein
MMSAKMVGYWTSKNTKAVVEKRRAELDLLIGFVNAGKTTPASQHLQSRIMDHLHRHPALHPHNRGWKADGNLTNLMDALQQRLRDRLGSIIENKLMLAEMPLWRISGSVSFALDPIKNRFHERFQLRKVKRGNEINALKKIMDIWLIEIIRDLDFSPRRFGQCPRCGGFFYSPTAKERIYCSTRCGGAARQEKFREERRAEDH